METGRDPGISGAGKFGTELSHSQHSTAQGRILLLFQLAKADLVRVVCLRVFVQNLLTKFDANVNFGSESLGIVLEEVSGLVIGRLVTFNFQKYSPHPGDQMPQSVFLIGYMKLSAGKWDVGTLT